MPSRILVVDDEAQIRELLSRALKEAGYETVAMNDGSAGLEAVSTAEVPFDLVVLNNCMPGLSGAQLVHSIRERFPEMPILHLDDRSRPGDPRLPDDVPNLYKPFSVDHLLSEVARLLAQGIGARHSS